MKKICFKCGEELDINEFYKHPKMGDGHLGKCKQCTKRDTKIRYAEKTESDQSWYERERERGREKYHRLYSEVRDKPTHGESARMMSVRSNIHRDLKLRPGFELHHFLYDDTHIKDGFVLDIKTHKRLHRHLRYRIDTMCFQCKTDAGVFRVGDLLQTKIRHARYIISLKHAGFLELYIN